MKKIIIVGPAYPYRGGNSLFVSFVYDILKNNFDVKLYSYKLLYPSILFPGKTQYDESGKTIKQAPNERLVNSINPFNWIKVASLIKKENADLIVFDWWHPFFSFCHFTISFLIKSYYKNKILFITENVISHEGNAVDKILTKFGLSNASAFLALSEKVENDLKFVAKQRKVYRSELPIYDCYNFDEKKKLTSTKKDLGFDEDSKLLLFFGYVRKYKGLDLLIDALAELIKKDNSYKLLVVGEFYDDEKYYHDKIKSLKLDKSVKTLNKFISNEEVAKYFEPADLVVLPYRSATQSGILNLAYGFLKPVLVTDVGGLAEFVDNGKTGYVIKPDSQKDLVDGIINFFRQRQNVNFAENIRNRVSKNSFNNLPSLFEEIISDSEK
ncbi:MAG TPA: glycosyl transferase family 1 [Ignavibacteriales bacterium]|nr:glycosyl transferase family 1 [Ignavibacteriales bacterium]